MHEHLDRTKLHPACLNQRFGHRILSYPVSQPDASGDTTEEDLGGMDAQGDHDDIVQSESPPSASLQYLIHIATLIRTNASQAASLQPVQGEPATQQSDSSRGSDSVATNPAKPLPVLSESDPVIAAPVPASSTGVASITQTKPPNNTGNGPFTSATSSIPTPSVASPKSPRPVQLSKNLTPQSLHRRVYFAESSLQDSYKHYRDLFHEHQKLKAQLDDTKRQLKELDREWECRMSKAWVVLRAKSEGD
ncbi:MAG: hypothetical protein Q9159_001568 [Coniocarpon cinnabarinum]